MSERATCGGCGEVIDTTATVPGPWAAAVLDVIAAARALMDASTAEIGPEHYRALRAALARLDGLGREDGDAD